MLDKPDSASFYSEGNGHSDNQLPEEMVNDLSSESLTFVESLYTSYLESPSSVSQEWRDYFSKFSQKMTRSRKPGFGPSFKRHTMFNPPGKQKTEGMDRQTMKIADRQERLDQLIRNYRVRGHILASLDPLGKKRATPPELMPEFYDFSERDYDRVFSTSTFGGPKQRTLREMIQWLRNTYCRSIGAQFMHIDSLRVRKWLQNRMESTANFLKFERPESLRILRRLTDSVVFEEFIQKKYVGLKSFSLEGAESLIPLLDLAIEKAGEQGVDEIVFGMAHRGRLNVLTNIMGKKPREIFREYEDSVPEMSVGRGDVKYHLGYSSDWMTESGHNVHLTLCFNPSHLEFVNPVAMGRMRAKQDRWANIDRTKGMVLLIHGDAAFAGEGVVQESLNLSELRGYRTGGTIHVVVNNQIGFTTDPAQSRSSTYATDVAKMLQIPIFHVNGEDPEAVAQVVRLAMDFRKEFHRDVVIDMYCYRRRGHNEGDEPAFTQPLMYDIINKRPSVRDSFLQRMLERKSVTKEDGDRLQDESISHLESELAAARVENYPHTVELPAGIWAGYRGGRELPADQIDTGVPEKNLVNLLLKQTEVPEHFTPHKKIQRLLNIRKEMAEGERKIDWGTAEALAFASLLTEGYRIRVSGQDAQRGTFSHRHAVLHDVKTGKKYTPLKHLVGGQGPVEFVNSPLSEAGVLGFDYGYSLDCPDGLIIWEAQFGDFCNAAQVIIDQFIVSAEDKWQRYSGMVMLLPHGFEGQGPEHSSARFERFLQLAAESNIQIAMPTTPDQFFHLLRRQMIRKWRKPLIVMTPKSLLRHRDAVSSFKSMCSGSFIKVIGDTTDLEPAKVKRILLCTGKIYYDLSEHRKQTERDDVAIIRMEQLYPVPKEELEQQLAPFPDGTPVYWVQEEPENMGAWRFMYCRFKGNLFGRHPLKGVYRPASASPATGSGRSHQFEQEMLISESFRKED
ncbi:2-oxoglutarate dehydrogenase E1 component [Gimesia sp.]|uniref:2-oxoglutarate dehydrogenase E1 component n=1 Tax=Gimesia sp. TaxID=2024833 RepID=UPI003A8D7054